MKIITIFLMSACLFLASNISVAASYRFHTDGSNSNEKHESSGAKWGGSGKSMPAKVAASGSKQFIFNPRLHMWAVYDGSGERIRQGIANGGSNYCHDIGRRCHTPTGSYRILSKGGVSCKSSKYPIKRIGGRVVSRGGAPMPYCMFFNSNFSIHGHTGLVNANVSHGCIRVSNEAAHWLQGYLPIGSKVTVLSY